MRVIAGQCRGQVLREFESPSIRPTKDQVKESMFNMLANLVDLSVSTVCDLFAGTGSLGIEALSRGAPHATFVEKEEGAIRVIRANLEKTRLHSGASIVQQDVRTFLSAPALQPFDVVLADPPYDERLGNFVVEKLCANGYLDANGVLIYESAPDEIFPPEDRFPRLLLYRRRRWGQTLIRIFRMTA